MSDIVFYKGQEFDEDVNYSGSSYHSFKFVNCHFKRSVVLKKLFWVVGQFLKIAFSMRNFVSLVVG